MNITRAGEVRTPIRFDPQVTGEQNAPLLLTERNFPELIEAAHRGRADFTQDIFPVKYVFHEASGSVAIGPGFCWNHKDIAEKGFEPLRLSCGQESTLFGGYLSFGFKDPNSETLLTWHDASSIGYPTFDLSLDYLRYFLLRCFLASGYSPALLLKTAEKQYVSADLLSSPPSLETPFAAGPASFNTAIEASQGAKGFSFVLHRPSDIMAVGALKSRPEDISTLTFPGFGVDPQAAKEFVAGNVNIKSASDPLRWEIKFNTGVYDSIGTSRTGDFMIRFLSGAGVEATAQIKRKLWGSSLLISSIAINP